MSLYASYGANWTELMCGVDQRKKLWWKVMYCSISKIVATTVP